MFAAGERVDVTGISKGKGFAGAMKRHNFTGQGASHGNHKKHRAPGSIGACATPARVFKGRGWPASMGNEQVTTLNLEVVEADAERDLLLVKGAVPGPNGGLVFVRNAVKAAVKAMSHASTMKTADRRRRRHRRARRRHLRHRAQRRGDAPGRHRAARRRAGPARRAPRPAPRCAAAAPSRGARRAPAAPARARSARRTGAAAAWPSAPSPASYAQRTPKKMIRLALRSALSDRAAEGKVVVVDDWGFDAPQHQGRRRRARRRSACAPGERDRVLLVLDRTDDDARGSASATSASACRSSLPDELNTYDVLVTTGSCSRRRRSTATRRRRAGRRRPRPTSRRRGRRR